MKRLHPPILFVVLAGAMIASSAFGAETRKLTLAEAVAIASKDTDLVKLAEQGVVAANERVEATNAQLFPRLSTQANLFVWDSPLEFQLGPMSTLVAREQITSNISVTVAQPLTGLIALLELSKLEKKGLEVANVERSKAKLDAAQTAAEAFLRTLQAKAVVDVTEKSLSQVDAQLERARVLEKGGMLQSVDVLRLEAARAATETGLVRARAGLTTARSALSLAVELEPGVEVEPVDDLPETPPKVTLTSADARSKAEETRPELQTARLRVEQAQGGRKVAQAGLYPNVVAIATYQHAEGAGPLQPKDAAFAGATLSWDVFEWGKTLDQMDEAEARINQARIGVEAATKVIGFDIDRRLLDVNASYETLSVVKVGLRAAEEAHRIQTVRYQQGAATTTDLLDAETELSRARTNAANARYEYYLALSGLARALGNMPPDIGAP